MKLQLASGLTIKPSSIHGKGCFATKDFKRRHKIAEYAGEKISNAEANRRAHRKTLRICWVNNRWSLDGSRVEMARTISIIPALQTLSCRSSMTTFCLLHGE